LAVSYGIIQEHGGRITVESTGVGTTFHIAFPLVNPREQLATASGRKKKVVRLARLQIESFHLIELLTKCIPATTLQAPPLYFSCPIPVFLALLFVDLLPGFTMTGF
jgi:hypothetical protein